MARIRSTSPSGDLPSNHGGGSPQPPSLSKRDKRRNMIFERVNDMVTSFAENRDSHYRAQIAAIQADMNLIMKADPYANKPLEDSGEDVAAIVASVTGGNHPPAPSAQADYASQVGRFYSRFVECVNDALEERDLGLTMLWNKHESALHELKQSYDYKVRLAQEEHRLLANTIRERLIQSISARKQRLLREKEQLDIADSNALLLHPNQYSINHPSSPGGAHSSRKTRSIRHRGVDPEDITHDGKRKRKAAFDNDENESHLEIGSPFRDAKARAMHSQFEAPAYSIDRLFTEKELSMNMNMAALATSNFFQKLKASNEEANGANGTHASDTGAAHEDTHMQNNGDAPVSEADGDATPAAPEMSRTHSHHATRGATRALNFESFVSNMPPSYPAALAPVILPANLGSKTNATAPPPSTLPQIDVEQDLMIMTRDAPPDDSLNEKLLENACASLRTREYEYAPPNKGPVHGGDGDANGLAALSAAIPRHDQGNGHGSGTASASTNGREPWQTIPDITSNVRAAGLPGLDLGGVPMSAQSSLGGYGSDGFPGGAPPMSRTASETGTSKRTRRA